jgi:beta-lactamase class A
MSLDKVISREIDDFDGTIGVAVKHFDTKEKASINGDELFPTASTRKVPIAVEFFRQVDEKKIDQYEKVVITQKNKGLGSPLLSYLTPGLTICYRDLAHLMIIYSCNTSADILYDKVGSENLNETMNKLGLMNSWFNSNSKDMIFDLFGFDDYPGEKNYENFVELFQGWDFSLRKLTPVVKNYGKATWSIGVSRRNNVSTPNDMLKLLELIVKNKAATEESCNTILDIMARTNKDGKISKYIDEQKAAFFHKPGSAFKIRNDVAIINNRKTNEWYGITCFTRNSKSDSYADETIAKISKSVYNYFHEEEK